MGPRVSEFSLQPRSLPGGRVGEREKGRKREEECAIYGAERWCRWGSGTEAAHGRASGGMGTCQGGLLASRMVSKRHGNRGSVCGGGWGGGGGRLGEAGPPGQSRAFWELGFVLIREVTVRQPLRFLSPFGKWIKSPSPESAAATVRTKPQVVLVSKSPKLPPAKDGAASG